MKIDPELKDKFDILLKNRVGTLDTSLGIEFIEIGKSKLVASMPVTKNNKQPFGLLHGGASVALAESLASLGAWLNVDETKFNIVGIEINANHLKAVRDGVVTGVATPIRIGNTLQVWEVILKDSSGDKTCISRCSLLKVAIK